jgi:hypothetical protein
MEGSMKEEKAANLPNFFYTFLSIEELKAGYSEPR